MANSKRKEDKKSHLQFCKKNDQNSSGERLPEITTWVLNEWKKKEERRKKETREKRLKGPS